MTTFANHSTNRHATIDRRTLTVTTNDGATTTHTTLADATARALAHVATPKPTPLNTALIRAMAGATTWRD